MAKKSFEALKSIEIKSHESLVSVYKYDINDCFVYVKMDITLLKSLNVLYKAEKGKIIDESRILNWSLCAACGLEALHEDNIIHRAIAPDNLMIDEKGDLKIGNYFKAKMSVEEQANTNHAGVLTYMAPEQEGDKYGKEVDIWGLGGAIIYEGCIGRYPVMMGMTIPQRLYLNLPDNVYSWDIIILLLYLLATDPKVRPSAAQLVKILEVMIKNFSESAPKLVEIPKITISEKEKEIDTKQSFEAFFGTITSELTKFKEKYASYLDAEMSDPNIEPNGIPGIKRTI